MCGFILAGMPLAWASGSSPGTPPGDTITITTPAQPASLGGAGGEQLAVTADSSESTITSVTVYLKSTATGKNVVKLQLTPPADGPQPGASTWTSSPLVPPGGTVPAGSDAVPLGTYTIEVTAKDSETSASGSAGTLPFVNSVHINLVKSNYVLSYTNQHPAFGATATESAPGATDVSPYTGPLVLDSSAQGVIPMTVKGAGYYVKLASPKAGETDTVEVQPGAAATAAGAAPKVALTDQVSPVKLAAKLSAAKVKYGATVEVSGMAEYTDGQSVKALTGQRVQIDGSNGKVAATATVDKSGNFTATLPSEPASQAWTVHAGGGQYLKPVAATLPMTVELPTAVTGFEATLGPNGDVAYSGCLGLAPSTPGYLPPLKGLVIQYSAGKSGPWHTLGAASAPKQRYACGDDGATFGGTLPVQLDRAYYRAYFTGAASHPAGTSSKAPATGFLASAGPVKLAWSTPTRMIDFTVSPRSVPSGGKLTVTGRLQALVNGRWQNYSRQVVQAILFPNGGKGWYWITRVKTSANGAFSTTFIDPVSATWSAEYLGNSTHLAAAGRPYVPVTVGSP